VTLEGVRDIPRDEWPTTWVTKITHPPENERVIHPDDDAWAAMTHMATGDLGRLLVMSGKKLVGMITRDSLMNLVRTKLELGM
jgi:CBS domain-containing protein